MTWHTQAVALMALLLAGCAPPLPDDPLTLFTLPVHAERLRNSGDIAALGGLVASAIDRNGPANDCDPLNLAPHRRDCRALLQALLSEGPQPWSGDRLDAGHIEAIARKLRWSGWRCPSANGSIEAGDPLRLSGDLAWLDCDGGETLDATLSIGLSLDDAATARLQIGFRGKSVELELAPRTLADEVDDVEMIVRTVDGRMHRLQLDYRPSSPDFALPEALGELDPASGRRLLQAALRQRDLFIDRLGDGDPLPELQIAERAADYLWRLPESLLRDRLDPLHAGRDPLQHASMIFARCRRDSAEASRACLMGAVLLEADIVAWLPGALEQAEQCTVDLPDVHPVRQHFAVLREALAFAGEQ